MKHVAEIRKFLREEKLYAYLLLGILILYAAIFAWGGDEPKAPSPAMEKVKQAERALREEKSEREWLKAALEKKPAAAFFLSVFTLMFLLGFGCGLILDVWFVTNLFYRRPVIPAARAPGTIAWGFRELAKVVILFFTYGFLASVLIGFLKKFAFQSWDTNFLMLLHTTVGDLMLFALIFYFVVKKCGKTLEATGLTFKSWAEDMRLGILGYLATLPVFLAVLLILVGIAAVFSYEPPPHPLVEVFVEEDKRNPWLIGYSIFLACLLGPVVEEIFFRGFCYPALKKFWGVPSAMMLTSALFAWIHRSTFAFAPIFVLGLILAYLYEKRGSLLPSMTMHVLHNSFFIGYFFLMKRIFLDTLT